METTINKSVGAGTCKYLRKQRNLATEEEEEEEGERGRTRVRVRERTHVHTER